MANFTRKQIAEAIAKYQKEHPLFMPMMYDVTSLPSIESADLITKEIRKCQDKIAKDTEMYLICEMAKMYMQGVVPHYEVRKTGEWIDTGDMQEYWAEEYQCSVCGAKDHWHNYCPNCGALMKGEEE